MEGAYMGEAGRSAGRVSEVEKERSHAVGNSYRKRDRKRRREMRRTVFMCIELIFFCWFFLPLLLKGILNVGNFAGMCLSALALFYTGKREYVSGLLFMLRENRGF